MKKLLLSIRMLLMALALFPILTVTCLADDLLTGFGGIAWSTALDAVKDCEKIEDRGDIHYCVRRNQAHTLLGEFVPEVLYGFYREAFFSVYIRIEDDEAYVATKSRLVDRLGTPESSLDKDGMVSVLRWTRDKVRVELHNDRSKEGFRLMYYYQPLADKAAHNQKVLTPSKRSKVKLFPAPAGDEADNIGILMF